MVATVTGLAVRLIKRRGKDRRKGEGFCHRVERVDGHGQTIFRAARFGRAGLSDKELTVVGCKREWAHIVGGARRAGTRCEWDGVWDGDWRAD